MTFTAENILLVGSVLIFSSILISKTGYRFGIPTLLLFLLVGMLFGSDGLGLQFNSASDAQFIGMMALSNILFTGHPLPRHQARAPSRYSAFYRRCADYHRTYRPVYLLHHSLVYRKPDAAHADFPATGGHHVVNRLCFRIQSAPFTEDESEREPASHAGT